MMRNLVVVFVSVVLYSVLNLFLIIYADDADTIGRWKAMTSLIDVNFTSHVTWRQTTEHVGLCGYLCKKDKKCLSFGYNFNNNVCQGHGHMSLKKTSEQFKMTDGAKYFISSCFDPPSVPNAVSSTPEYVINTSIVYSCKTGYFGTGNPITDCLPNNSWTVPTFECKACPDPSSIQNAVYSSSSEYLVNTSVTYECNSGYIGTGNPNIDCLADATWSIPTYQCKACPEPPSIVNAAYSASSEYLVHTSVVYNCNSGFYGVGSPTIDCLADATWTVPTFECKVCGGDYVLADGIQLCYKLYYVAMTYWNAKAFCNSVGERLLKIDSTSKGQYFNIYLNQPQFDSWDVDCGTIKYGIWINGEYNNGLWLDEQNMAIQNIPWNPDTQFVGTCISLACMSDYSVWPFNRPCSRGYVFICEKIS